ncbi:type II secretion system protein [Ruminiclostridium cellobioparum]|jgi:type IV pilus assembly protein PilA|uniref:type II secretion system protein n=1 Tax=Ruminiclostridium cellobioparum TaxID=29355 RepID=UPI000686D3BB|nr:prepilin-type N-terminal cleavage/methylation domain-containing protein [Ruminiclostridium cellobioparum]
MNSVVLSTSQEIKGGEKLKKLKNNKGFSLVELLIVIAIMGVLAVIAFNMFGGVLTSSKKKADDQMAQNISKSILTYCIDSNDWTLAEIEGNGANPMDFLIKLGGQTDIDGKLYGPYITLKNPDEPTDDANKTALAPQWNKNAGGDHTGWEITVYTKLQNVKCVPSTEDAESLTVKVDETTGGAAEGT